MRLGNKLILATLLTAFTATASADPAAIWIYPSGGDDTANLQAALDSCSGPPNCVIRLAEGVFHTNTLVAHDFHGQIRGRGRHSTIISPVEGQPLNVNDAVPYFAEDPTVDEPYPFLMTFADGDIVMSDLSFEFPDGALDTGTWYDSWFGFCDPAEGYLAGVVLATGREPVDFTVRDVSITGGAGPFFDVTNVRAGIYYKAGLLRDDVPPPTPEDCEEYSAVFLGLQPLSGRFVAHGNTMTGLWNTVEAWQITDADVSMMHNELLGTGGGPTVLEAAHSTVTVKHNLIDVTVFGVLVRQNDFGPPVGEGSSFVISHNDILVNARGDSPFGVGFVGVQYEDVTTDATSDELVDIRKNTIQLGPDVFDGMWLFGDEGALRVAQNDFSGAALATSITADATSGCEITKNGFDGFIAGEADILLTESTSHCLVVAPEGTVVDLGTDNTVIVP